MSAGDLGLGNIFAPALQRVPILVKRARPLTVKSAEASKKRPTVQSKTKKKRSKKLTAQKAKPKKRPISRKKQGTSKKLIFPTVLH